MNVSDELLTAGDVAALCGVKPSTVLDWWQSKKIPGFRLGGTPRGRLRFRRAEIEAVFESWRDGGPAPATTSLSSPLGLVDDRRGVS